MRNKTRAHSLWFQLEGNDVSEKPTSRREAETGRNKLVNKLNELPPELLESPDRVIVSRVTHKGTLSRKQSSVLNGLEGEPEEVRRSAKERVGG